MTNYQRGSDFERRVGKDLAANGYEVFRSAGSRGKADLVAIKAGQILLVQCKRNGKIPREEWNDLLGLADRIDPTMRVAFPLVASMPGARGIKYVRVMSRLGENARRKKASTEWGPE
jgi:Holliday junction resolvase